jgi:NAD(P)H-hydrate epimerase
MIMKLFKSEQVKDIDAYTIKHEPITSPDLMERASKRMTDWLLNEIKDNSKVFVIAGPGNNGGDGLVIARLLAHKGFDVMVCLLRFSPRLSDDCQLNLNRYLENGWTFTEIEETDQMPNIPNGSVIIDAIFGAGLTRPVKGLPAEVIQILNKKKNVRRIAVDAPSGLFGEDNTDNDGSIFQAHDTLAIQFPNRSFFFTENYTFVGEIHTIDIGLHPKAIENTESDWYLLQKDDIRKMYRKRSKFEHKGNFGHALLISGSYGKTGAAVLASKACLRAGVGLLTVHAPKSGYDILQQSVPEAMLSIDRSDLIFTGCDEGVDFDAVGIGPGLGKKSNTQKGLAALIKDIHKPMVLDADALNIIAENKNLLNDLPENSIITPHPKEFERLFGKTDNAWQQTQAQIKYAKEYKIIIVLKEAYTKIAVPDGRLFVNSTGNPGMATAGTGDVLTGIVLSLLAQAYDPDVAARLAVYLHGMAGDLAAGKYSQPAMTSGDIPEMLGEAFKKL